VSELSRQRAALWERCDGLCEVSGRPLDYETFDMHHRRNKGMGGTSRPNTDALYNLLALDPEIHNGGPTSVHGRRDWSEANGFLIPKNADYPQQWPVKLRARWWVLLPATPGYVPIPRSLVESRNFVH